MATQEWHTQCQKLQGPALVPGVVHSTHGSCALTVQRARSSSHDPCLAGRQHIRVKGLSHGSQHASLWYGELCRRRKLQPHSGLTSLSRSSSCAGLVGGRRGVISTNRGRQRNTASTLSSWNLHAATPEWQGCANEFPQQRLAVSSHPVSVPSSTCASASGSSRVSETGSAHSDVLSTASSTCGVRKVLGLPELPQGRGSGLNKESKLLKFNTSLLVVREFLRRDYAIGYLLLGWLLRTTWVIAPSVAKLLHLPQPDTSAARTQLPALAAWMLTGASDGKGLTESECEQVLSQLTADELRRLQEQLDSPDSAMTSFGRFMQAQQTLSGAPATVQQMAGFLKRDQQLRESFRGISPSQNLAGASSAAAAMAQLSATERSVLAASSAASAMAQLAATQQNVEGACYATTAMTNMATGLADSQRNDTTSGVVTAATVGAVASMADTVAAIAETTMDVAIPGLGSVLVELANRVGAAMHQVSRQLTTTCGMQITEAGSVEADSKKCLDPAAALQQLLSLQQKLPAKHDSSSMLQEYQVWLNEVKKSLVQQHETTQIHLLHLESELVLAASSLQQSQTHQQQVVEQQQLLQQARQQALDRYQEATDTISQLLQQMDAGVCSSSGTGSTSLSTEMSNGSALQNLGTLVTQAEGAEAEVAAIEQQLQMLMDKQQTIIAESERIQAQLQSLQTSHETLAAADSEQVAVQSELDDVMSSLKVASADVAENTDRAVEELDALMQLLMKKLEGSKRGAAIVPATDIRAPAAATVDGALLHGYGPEPEAVPEALYVLDSTEEPTFVGEDILADADSIIAEAEQVAGSHGENTELSSQQTIASSFSAYTQMGPTRRARILTPPRPADSDKAAIFFIDQPQQSAHGIPQLPTDQQVGEVASRAELHGTGYSLVPTTQQQGTLDREGQPDWLTAWANNQLASGLASIQQAGTAAAGAYTAAAAAVTEAKSKVDGKVDGKVAGDRRTFKEEVLAVSGLLSLISPNWWTEEALGSASTPHSAGSKPSDGQKPAMQSTAAAEDAMVQEAYGSDGSGKDGAGGAGGGRNPKGGGGGGGTADDSNSNGSGGDGNGDGGPGSGGGGGGNGGKGPTGPGDAWDGFEQFPPPGSLDPVVLLPVAFAVAVAGLQKLLGSACPAENHLQDASSSSAIVAQTPAQEPVASNAAGRLMQKHEKHGTGRIAPMSREERMQAVAEAAAAAALRAGKAQGSACSLHGLSVPDSSTILMADAESVQHLLVRDPAHELHLAPPRDGAGGQAVKVGVGSSLESSRAVSINTAETVPAGYAGQVVPSAGNMLLYSSQQVSWEELEELPLIARQEILSLRAIAARNNNMQSILEKQLQAVQRQIAGKDAELAASTAKSAQLQAELTAALADLRRVAKGDMHGDSLAGGQSVKELKQGYQSQISMLAEALAGERTSAATHIAALQVQLEMSQMTAAHEQAGLQARLAKAAVSRTQLQRGYDDMLAVLQADLAKAQQQACEWRATAESAEASFVAAQEQLRVASTEATAQLAQSKALLAAEEDEKHSMQARLEATLGELKVVQELTEQQAQKLDVTQKAELSAHQVAVTAGILEHADEIAVLKRSCEQLQEELAAITEESSKEIARFSAEMQAKEDALHAKVQSLQAALQQQETIAATQTANMQQEAASLAADLQAAQQGFSQYTQGLEIELAEAREAHQIEVNQLSAVLTASQEDVKRLTSTIQLLMDAITGKTEQDDIQAGFRVVATSSKVQATCVDSIDASLDILQGLRADNASLNTTQQQQLDHISSLEQQLAVSTKQHEQQLLKLQVQLSDLTGDVTAAAAQCLQLEQQVQLSTQQKREWNASAVHSQRLESELDAALSNVAQLQQNLGLQHSDAAATIFDLQGELQQTKDLVSQLQSQLQQSRDEASASKSEVSNLQADAAAATAAAMTTAAAVASLLPTSAATVGVKATKLMNTPASVTVAFVVNQLQQQVEQLSGQHTKVLSDLTAQGQELASVKRLLEQQQTLAADERQKAAASEQQLSQVTAQLAEARQEAEQRTANIVSLTEKLAVAGAKVQAVQAELSQLHSRHVAETSLLEEAAQSVTERCDELQRQLATATAAADQLLQRLSDTELQHQGAIHTAHVDLAAAVAASADRVLVLDAQLAAAEAATIATQITASVSAQEVSRLSRDLDSAKVHAVELETFHSAALAALKAEHANALAQAAEAATVEVKHLKDAHETATSQLEQKHAAAVEELQQQAASAAEACNMTHDEAVGRLTAEVSQKHAELAALKASSESKLQELQQQHQAAVQELLNKQAVELAAAKQQAAEALENLAIDHAAAIDLLRHRHTEQTAAIQQQVEAAKFEAQREQTQLQQQHEGAVVALQEQHASALAAAEQEAATAMAEMRKGQEAAMRESNIMHQARLEELQQQMSAAADAAKLEAAQLQSQVQAAEAACAAAEQNASLTASTLAALESQLSSLRSQSEHEVAELKSQQSTAAAVSAAQLQALEQQVKDLQTAVEAAVADRDRMQQEFTEATTAAFGREDNLKQQLEAAKEGLQANIQQMETAADDLAAAEAVQAQLVADKTKLAAERTSLLHRCQAAELQLLHLQEQQAKELEQLLLLRDIMESEAAVTNNVDTLIAAQPATATEMPLAGNGVTKDVSSTAMAAEDVSTQPSDMGQLIAQIAELTVHGRKQQQKRCDQFSVELMAAEDKALEWQAAAQAAEAQHKAADSAHQELQQLLQVHETEAAAAQDQLKNTQTQLQQSQSQYQGAVQQLAALQASYNELQALYTQQQLQSERVTAQLSSSDQEVALLRQRVAETLADRDQLAAKELDLQQHISGLQQKLIELEADATSAHDRAAQVQLALEAAEGHVKQLQQQLEAAEAAAGDADTARVHAEEQTKAMQQSLESAQKDLHTAKEQITAAEEAQTALTMQLLEKSQEIKLFKDDSTASARSWRLPAEAGLGSTTGSTSVETALAEAKQQLNCWEEDVMALQFVAGHESLEDIADLDVTYNISHLESIHKAIVKLRKAAADATAEASRLSAMTSISRLSSAAGDSLSPRGTWRMGSSNSAASSPRSSISAAKSAAAAKLAALEAQAGKATTRSLAVGSALDSSMQAMQAAKQSLLSMHHNDLKLELISQSVQEVLAGKSQTSSLQNILDDIPADGQPSSSDLAGTGLTATPTRTSTLLAARTTQEADEFVARLASTSDGGAAGHLFDAEVAAEGHGLAVQLQHYKQQVEELSAVKLALQQEVEAAREVAHQLAAVQADKEAADAANKQLLLQVQVLSDEASSLQQTTAQLAELQAANIELSLGNQQLESSLSALREEVKHLRLQQEDFEQQNSKVRALEDEVTVLQLQLQNLLKDNKDLADQLAAARAAMHFGGAALLSASNDTAVSAVRAVTQSLMLHSGRFSVSMDDEQMMLPTNPDDMQASSLRAKLPSQEAADADSTSSLQPLQKPLQAGGSLLSKQALMQSLRAREDGMEQSSSAMTRTEYMRYSGTANMTFSMPEGISRKPTLPTTEDCDTEGTQQQLAAAVDGTSAAVGPQAAITTATAGGVVALRTGPDGKLSALHSQEVVVLVPVNESDVASDGGVVAKQLAQQAVEKLKQEEGMERRGSWPGDPKAVAHVQNLASIVHDISELGELSSELVQQQVAVQQQLAASQALARSMSQQASARDVSMEEVMGHFFKVYNVACYVAADRERVLDLLIDARSVNQDQASQLAQRSGQIQQLASDRDLALQKLWHSEEKLVAMEAQLLELQQQVQDKQQELAAKAAALDVAECAHGPLAELNAEQLQQWRRLLTDANQIVNQQKSLVQSAVERWKRSSECEDMTCGTAVIADTKGDSSSQLAWLQQEQLWLMQELESLAAGGINPVSTTAIQQSDDEHQQLAVLNPPENSSSSLSSIARRMAAMQKVVEQVSLEVSKKTKEAAALQDSLTQAEAAKHLLRKQLENRSGEAAAPQQLKASKDTASAASPTGVTAAVSPAGGGLQRQRTASNVVELTAQGTPSVLDIDLQPGKPGYVLEVAQHFDPGFRRLSSPAPGSGPLELSPSASNVAHEDRAGVADVKLGLTRRSLPPLELSTLASSCGAALPQTAASAELPAQLLRKGSLTPKPAALGSLAGSARVSPASSPRQSGIARGNSGHWVPASVSLSPRTGSLQPAVTSPRSPIMSAAAAAAGLQTPGSSRIHGMDSSTVAGFKKSGSQLEAVSQTTQVTKRSIPSAAAASSGGSSTSSRSASALPSRIPGVAGASSGAVSRSVTPTTNSSAASSPMVSPRVGSATAAASHRSSPVFKASRSTATGTAGSRTGATKAGSLSASADSAKGSSGGTDGLGRKLVRMLSGGGSKGSREGVGPASTVKSSASKTKSVGGRK